MAISRANFLAETESKGSVSESDPLLEIKRIHAAIDKRTEWFKRHKRKGVIQNEGDARNPHDLFLAG